MYMCHGEKQRFRTSARIDIARIEIVASRRATYTHISLRNMVLTLGIKQILTSRVRFGGKVSFGS